MSVRTWNSTTQTADIVSGFGQWSDIAGKPFESVDSALSLTSTNPVQNKVVTEAIQQGGGGGSTVTWTQITQSGTKIARISINGTQTDVYAPTGGGGGSTPTWGQIEGTLSSQTDLQTALDGKVNTDGDKGLSTNDYTDLEKQKLSDIEPEANKYELPTATTSVLGGVKVDGTSIKINNGVISSDNGITFLAPSNVTTVEGNTTVLFNISTLDSSRNYSFKLHCTLPSATYDNITSTSTTITYTMHGTLASSTGYKLLCIVIPS